MKAKTSSFGLLDFANAIVAACDADDGIKDGMIFTAGACPFDPAALACDGAKTDACLLPDQVAALKKAFAGTSRLQVADAQGLECCSMHYYGRRP